MSSLGESVANTRETRTELDDVVIGHRRRFRRLQRREARRIAKRTLGVAGTAQVRRFVRANWRAVGTEILETIRAALEDQDRDEGA